MRCRLLVAAVVVVSVMSGCSSSEQTMVVDQGSARITGDMGSIYLEIDNQTGHDDALIGASVDPAVAESVEIHETTELASTDGNGAPMLAMQETERVEIPANTSADLAPGRMHLMLTGVNGDSAERASMTVRLQFEKSGFEDVEVEVLD